jgi:hypothetical protein
VSVGLVPDGDGGVKQPSACGCGDGGIRSGWESSARQRGWTGPGATRVAGAFGDGVSFFCVFFFGPQVPASRVDELLVRANCVRLRGLASV